MAEKEKSLMDELLTGITKEVKKAEKKRTLIFQIILQIKKSDLAYIISIKILKKEMKLETDEYDP